MPPKGRRSAKAPRLPAGRKQAQDPKDAQAYDHEEKLLLRPDVGLQSQFKQKKQPKTYRYDPSLDPALSWDVSVEPDPRLNPFAGKVIA
jgi:hypothetical protein